MNHLRKSTISATVLLRRSKYFTALILLANAMGLDARLALEDCSVLSSSLTKHNSLPQALISYDKHNFRARFKILSN